MVWTTPAQTTLATDHLAVTPLIWIFDDRKAAIWKDTLLIPAVVAAASATLLLVHLFFASVWGRKLFLRTTEVVDSPPAIRSVGFFSETKRHIAHHGGGVVFGFKLVRLLCCLFLLALSIASRAITATHKSKVGGLHLAMTMSFFYASILAAVTVSAKLRWSSIAVKHLNTWLVLTLTVYGYRDLFPFVTYRRIPFDESEGWILWARVFVLLVAAVVVPLFIPRPYVPFDPKDPMPIPNPEQTASIVSTMFYFFMDPIVFSHRLPPLADSDYSANLKTQNFKYLEASASNKRHLFFGIIRAFRLEYLAMTASVIVMVSSNFVSPIGINRLLDYLEKPGEEPVVKPWFWILWLFMGPMMGSTSYQWYNFLATRTFVRCEAILTQLVFEHALRIRIKAEPADKSSTNGASTPEGETSFPIEQEHSSEVETLNSTDAVVVLRDVTLLSSSASIESAASSKAKGKRKETSDVKDEPVESGDTRNFVGKITNLVTTDLGNITDSRDALFLLLVVPLDMALGLAFLYQILGWSSFVGMGVMILLLPLPGYVAKMVQTVQQQRLKKTDARVQTVTESALRLNLFLSMEDSSHAYLAMNAIRMIKLSGWERQMNERVAEKREEELSWLWKRQLLDLLIGTLNFSIPVVAMVATYGQSLIGLGIYLVSLLFLPFRTESRALRSTVIMKESLAASKVFSSMSIFDLLRNELHYVSWTLNQAVAGKVSLDRINEFFHKTELLDAFAEKDPDTPELFFPAPAETDRQIGFCDATFVWSTENTNGNLTPFRRKFTLKVEGELLFQLGCINLVVGPTGSGKTSLLMALLGEMHFIPTSPTSWYNLPRANGGVSYAAQESWVQNETIKENILFGTEYDEARYKKVLHQCALERDLELVEAGDGTYLGFPSSEHVAFTDMENREVGEKGITLSGGQKARITLARALYAKTEIILLDDVLAALDVHTARWIVDKCLCGDLIEGRTVIMVTHNVAMVKPVATYIVSMGLDGHIRSHGLISNALNTDEILAEELAKDQEVLEKKTDEVDAPAVGAKKAGGKLIVAEEIEEGHVSWDSLKLYFNALGGNHAFLFFTFLLTGLGLTSLSNALQTWFLGYWARRYTMCDPSEVDVFHYLGIFFILILVGVCLYAVTFIFYTLGVFRASKWLDVTPASRGLWDLFDMSMTMFVKFAAVISFTPSFLIPGVLIGALGGWCGQIYMAAQLSVKREMSNAKAPVLSHFGAAIAGLTSIRAYGAQNSVVKISLDRIDKYTRTARTFYNLNRWTLLAASLLVFISLTPQSPTLKLFQAASLACYLVYFQTYNPSSVGFSLNMAIGFSGMILWWVRVLNDFEIQGNSLERIRAYTEIEQEPKPTPVGVPPAYWPASGRLSVEGLSAKYSIDGPKVLHDLSFNIQPGERVGVVGRTGSGKSSLTLALLRCIFTEGTVYYDGIPTSTLNLNSLRSNITIIPQTPELLTGSLRKNLDLFEQFDDATLNSALQAAGLFALQSDMDEGKLTLDSEISAGGNNLSVGQRHILALARAIVRGSKLLILDEATSAIDYKTDAIIQSSLRNELLRDTTLLTVAHRLQTIMDADKIMVLDAGRIVEFDSPKELLKNKHGMLRALVDESGDKLNLYEMAGL
ncbi:ATP-binding cassette transporter [Mycena sanguinolenta]|uniref:ATP-binding cassette transporter n=1 Tax=Mycena sanguinolenta TaxID=230812 RepID=A0A8H7D9V2_9AGAR|nr:ATP-binding cassette transporter [Mycena sanguinolenta]